MLWTTSMIHIPCKIENEIHSISVKLKSRFDEEWHNFKTDKKLFENKNSTSVEQAEEVHEINDQ